MDLHSFPTRRSSDLALAQAGDDAGEDAEDRLEDDRDERQADRDRERVGELAGDRLAAERRPQVALEDVRQVQEVLHQERLVEVELLAEADLRGLWQRLVAAQRRGTGARPEGRQTVHA